MKAHTKAILSWRNILTNKLTLINDKRTFFQLLFHLEKARKRRLISHVVLSVDVGILRANNICHCMHTSLSLSLYTLLWLHLMCPDGLDLNLFIHTHTHRQPVSFSIRLRCRDVTREKWTIELRKRHWCEWNIFIRFFSLFYAILHLSFSANDSRLIKLAQCVNLIRRFPSYSISFHRRHFPPLCIAKLIYMCVCFITRIASLDLLKLARKERVRLNRFFLWHTRSVHSSRKETVLRATERENATDMIPWNCFHYCCAHKLMLIFFLLFFSSHSLFVDFPLVRVIKRKKNCRCMHWTQAENPSWWNAGRRK